MNPEYDVIIIGGGINGAAVASALTRQGYRILLLEGSDFAAGTTAASTKLIHGGFRYLASGDPGLVHESLQARELLLRQRPHLVQPLAFILPVYAGEQQPGAVIRAGLVLYDLLSPRKVSPWHRSFSTRELQRQEPTIQTAGLTSAFLFHDAQVLMPERLCMEYLSEARVAGADLRNYCLVDAIVVSKGVAQGVEFHDALTGRRHGAGARLVINAAGPWVDGVLALTGRALTRRIGGTKGSHLVLQLDGRGPQHAIIARAHSDGRHIFAIPWLDHHLIGTTDTYYHGDPGAARCEEWEVGYLLTEVARILPGIGVDREHVLYSYSGVRPFPHRGSGVSEGEISRRSYIINHEQEGVARLLSIVGGKLTTGARLGEATARSVRRVIGAAPRSGRPRDLPVRGPGHVSFLPAETLEHLRGRYGQRGADVAAYAAAEPPLAEPISPCHAEIGAEVAYAVEQEGARTVGDVLLRRTPVGLTHDLGRAAAPATAAIMQARLGWTDAQRDRAVQDYEAELQRRFVIFPRGRAVRPAPTGGAVEAQAQAGT